MTRKSSKANKEKRSKEPEVERFRTLEELNSEFSQRKQARFRSLMELTKEFEDQETSPQEDGKILQSTQRAVDEPSRTHGTGVLKKIFEGRGFGFITPDQDHGAGDVFLHFSDVTSGGARNLGIGTWVRYDIEPDTASGRLRAKNVSVMPTTPSTAESESPSPAPEVTYAPSSPNTCAYNRDIMLGIFKALVSSSRLDKASSLKLSTVPMPPSSRRDQEDPYLDDERLIARLEERLDKETGADALNMQTFGATSGWSFEEAVAANEKLRIIPDVEDCTTAGGSFSEPADVEVSERGEESDRLSHASDDRREPPAAAGDEAPGKDRTWSWEESSHQAKLLEDHRHSWEVEQKHAAPLPVFQ